MKLNFFHNQQIKNNSSVLMLEEEGGDEGETLERPIGISKAEWTPEFIAHLKDIKARNPKLYHKIKIGH